MFPKNIEIAGSKSCLLTFDWGDREYTGFKDGENCILFETPRDALRKVLYYLDDKELLTKITNNGYELVQKNHNVVDTVKQLFTDIEKEYNL
jgi:spore maturation protein CgeB